MVIKFNQYNESCAFLHAAKEFVRFFGLSSNQKSNLIIICIQNNPTTEYSDSEFESVFNRWDGARYLVFRCLRHSHSNLHETKSL
jgi:hypothetical protein